ncbi:HAD family hydrolase [Baekduia soli]|uniref:HAD family hydrolase n=1 Tax=Baekduia soli TaxID=496014 RepID=A0A5B8U9C4_9ACTN|nr:HAD hydrolase-like protein [Baekduia soli]QEC49759.1 HAD family hydrolase [Baekduia soli]
MIAADAVLFDLDGVLVDSRAAFVAAVNGVLEEQGRAPRPAADLHPFIGPPLHRTFATLAPELDDAGLDALVLAYRVRYRAGMVAGSRLFDGVAATLGLLAQTMPLVVATSKAHALARPLLEALGIAEHFAAIVGPSLQARDESKALTIGRALRDLPHSRRPVMIGDRKFDVLGARAHDVPCIGALWGVGGEAELVEAGAAALAERPEDLPALLGA